MASVAFNQYELAESLPRTTAPVGDPQKCVLLIEDSEEAMFLVRCALQEYGKGVYRLEWADGLTNGLERLKKGGVDLVLLDLGLPDSSGPASYAGVHEVAPEVPVLVLTGDTREETATAVAATGVDDYLIKDEVSGSLLMQAIRAALHASKRGDMRKHKQADSEDEKVRIMKVRSFTPFETDSKN